MATLKSDLAALEQGIAMFAAPVTTPPKPFHWPWGRSALGSALLTPPAGGGARTTLRTTRRAAFRTVPALSDGPPRHRAAGTPPIALAASFPSPPAWT